MSSGERVWFVLSIAFLAFTYGFLSHAWGLFPKSYVEEAWRQARLLYDSSSRHARVDEPVYNRAGARTRRPDAVQPGLTLITSMWKGKETWQPGLKLIDQEGEVLHKWSINPEAVFGTGRGFVTDPSSQTDIHGSLLLEDGDVVVNLTYIGTVRMNSCGEVQWTLREGGHHSISRGEDGTFWIPAVSPEKRSSSTSFPNGFPGLDDPVWVDRILHVSADGKILKDIPILEVLYENQMERDISRLANRSSDITHMNDVEPLSSTESDAYPLFESGDLLVSLHHMNMVLVVDPETKKVKWFEDRPFSGQHDPDFTGGGWIGVFDNGYNRKYNPLVEESRIVSLLPHRDSTATTFQPNEGDRFYTPIRGKWQTLGNGNLLLTESEAARVAEVSPDGDLVWEWIQEPKDGKVPSVTKSSRHDLTAADVASWPCSSLAEGR